MILLSTPRLGLVNEAGEFAGKIKKIFRDKGGEFSPEDKEALKGELGDVLVVFDADLHQFRFHAGRSGGKQFG